MPEPATGEGADLSPLSHEIVLDLPPADAFALFARRLGDWWPLAYTFSEADFASAWIEPRAGGRWLERDAAGRERPWGEVRAWEEGRRLVLSFAIGADRQPAPNEQASEVEVRFAPAGDGRTRVRLEHRQLEKHGESAPMLRAGMGSPQGWPLILAELRRAARRP